MPDPIQPDTLRTALETAALSKAAADASAQDLILKQAAETAAHNATLDATKKAADDAAKLDADRAALTAEVQRYFQVGAT